MQQECIKKLPSFYNVDTNSPIRRIELNLGDCYGGLCAIYKVEIDITTRRFLFYGYRNIKKLGFHKGIVPSYFLQLLIDFIKSICIFGLNSEYISRQIDLQNTTIVVILQNGVVHSITFDDLAAPAQLIALRLMINYVINRSTWVL